MEQKELNPMAKIALKSIVSLREKHKMTLSGCDLYCSSVYEILDSFIQALEENVTNERPDLYNFLKKESRKILLQNPLSEVSTEHKVMKSLKQFCGYVEPFELTLGSEFVLNSGDGRENIQDVGVTGFCVPFEKQLAHLLSNNEVFDYCFGSSSLTKSTDSKIRNVKDGSVFKDHPVCQKYEKPLLFQIYEDDVELTNPLGSHTKVHKVTVMYWSLLNIPDHARSNLKSFNLLGICKASSIKKFGFEAMFDDFFENVQKLESTEGLNLKLENGNVINVHGTLLSVSGDGLALNYIGGYKEGIGFAFKPCRNCNLNKDEIKAIFYETNLRTIEEHRDQVKRLQNECLTKKEREEISKNFGICGDSVFSKLDYFDVTKCLCQDLMHNLNEGVEEVEIRGLLFELIENQKLLTFEDLNYLLKAFPYPLEFAGAKPSPIERNHVLTGKLRQTAAQMLTLLYTLPIMLEPFAKGEARKYLETFALLSKIGNILLAYEVDRQSITLLRYMIFAHHSRYSELYPNHPPTPKFHFLVHSPSLIELFGPSRGTWTMRYEAMNAWISKVGEDTRNFKNICKTLATRFQVKKCLDFEFGNSEAQVFGEKSFMTDNPRKTDISTYRLAGAVLKEFDNSVGEIYETDRVWLLNFEIKLNSVLMIKNEDDSLPEFGQVRALFTQEQNCALVFQVFETNGFNQITNCYEVVETNRYTCRLHSKVSFLHPLPVVRMSGKINILLQYHCRSEFIGI